MFAFERNYTARTKHAPWGGPTGDGTIVLPGEDLSAASFVWAFAATEGGSPLITLGLVSIGNQGVWVTYDAGYVSDAGVVVGATTIVPFINETALEGLSWGSTAATDPITLRHNLLIDPTDAPQRLECFGNFTLYPGVGD